MLSGHNPPLKEVKHELEAEAMTECCFLVHRLISSKLFLNTVLNHLPREWGSPY